MTVIAWDGKVLAGDKQASCAGVASTVTKVHKVPGGIVGFAGHADTIGDMLVWFKGNRESEFPPSAKDGATSALFVADDGKVLIYCSGPNPMPEAEKFYAIGAGRDYALAAMHLGFGAKKAVETACALSTTCGRGIDVLRLK